jgi:hypothetical protein
LEDIFLTAVKVIVVQCQAPERLAHFAKQKEFVRRLKVTQNYLVRKLDLDAKSRKIPEKRSRFYVMTNELRKASDLF